MSVNYGGRGYSPYYGPTGKVDFGWIGESWEIFKRDAGIWVGALVVYWAILFVAQIPFQFSMQSAQMSTAVGPPPTTPLALLHKIPAGPFAFLEFVNIVGQLFFMGSLFTMALKAVRNLPLQFSDAFSGGPLMLPMLGLGLLAFFFNLLGMLALFVGSLFTMGLMLPAYAMVADREPVISAFSRSIEAMKNDWLKAGGFVLVAYVFYFVAVVVTCGFGVLVAIPMLVIIITLAYRDMVGMEGIVDRSNPYAGYGYPYQQQQPPAPGIWPPAPGQSISPAQPPSFGQPPVGQQPSFGQPPVGQQQPPAWPQQQQTQPSTSPPPTYPPQPSTEQSPPSGWPQQPPPEPSAEGSTDGQGQTS